MTTDHELQEELASRMHCLVAQPPAGRNLMPGIRKAAHRRRTRVAAVSSSLGVTGVVVAGAVTAASLKGNPTAPLTVAATPSSDATPAVAPSAAATPSAAAATSAAPSAVSTSPVPPSDKAVPTSPAPSHVQTTSLGDTAADLLAAPYYYQRTINEQYGRRTERRAWIGRTAQGHVEQPLGGQAGVQSIPIGTAEFSTNYGEKLSWADFTVAPSSGQLHEWMYATRAQQVKDFGYDLAGTTRGNQLAFKEGEELLSETPTVPAFRLAVLDAMKQVPGVVVTSPVTDEIGRTGVQLSLNAGPNMGVGTTLDIVDPSDGRLLQSTLADTPACSAGSVIWRAVYLEAGAVPDDTSVLPEVAVPTLGQAADCVLPGEQTPPAIASAAAPGAAKR